MTANKFKPNWAPHPGVTLRETMSHYGLGCHGLARKIGFSPEYIDEVVEGKSEITDAFAVALEREFGVDRIFWINLEHGYQTVMKHGKHTRSKPCLNAE